jgi:hypothetical protein
LKEIPKLKIIPIIILLSILQIAIITLFYDTENVGKGLEFIRFPKKELVEIATLEKIEITQEITKEEIEQKTEEEEFTEGEHVEEIKEIVSKPAQPIVESEELEIPPVQRKILENAKEQCEKFIENKFEYYNEGYPPENEGIATDVVARAIKAAGYDIRELIYEDMLIAKSDYPFDRYVNKIIDKNIDFRRVPHQEAFFKKFGKTLTTTIDPNNSEIMSQWMPGDIVFFDLGIGDELSDTVGIVSDKLNEKGIPYIITSADPPGYVSELNWLTEKSISGHYRYPP